MKNKITYVSTLKMSQNEWLEHRKKAIGGSDASTIVGLNPYSSMYELWADKLGMIPPKEENEAMRLGHDLEEYVAKRFCEVTGKKVKRKNAIIYNSDFPFAHANVDRMIIGESAGLECKTTSVLNLKKFRDGEFPATYYVQCQHYMMVTGLEKWYLAVLILGKEFLWFEINRNDEDIRALAESEKIFWKYVQSKTEPPVDGSDSCTKTLNMIYCEDNGVDIIDLTPLETALKIRSNADKQIKELEALKKQKENEIKAYLQSATVGACNGFSVCWKSQTRMTFDHKKFATEHPEFDLSTYYKESKTRVLKIKEEN